MVVNFYYLYTLFVPVLQHDQNAEYDDRSNSVVTNYIQNCQVLIGIRFISRVFSVFGQEMAEEGFDVTQADIRSNADDFIEIHKNCQKYLY